jgi:hypothetical protein
MQTTLQQFIPCRGWIFLALPLTTLRGITGLSMLVPVGEQY